MDRFVAEQRITDLPPAPGFLPGLTEQALYGQFMGRCGEIDWAKLPARLAKPGWWRRLHHKRWQYVGIACPDCFIGAAIVDVGWTSAAFAYVFDRTRGAVVGGLSKDGLPWGTAKVAEVPRVDAGSHFHWQGAHLEFIEHAPEQFRLKISGPDALQIEVELDGRNAAPWLLATGPVAGGVWHATHKSPALQVTGTARAGGRIYTLDGGFASLDHSNGLLPRRTRWLWASAHSPELGFNLQAGYFGTTENALWLDGQLIPLAAAEFDYDPDNTQQAWRVKTVDGLLDLRFIPEGERREDRNLILAASRYVQPVGCFEGWVKASSHAPARPVNGLLGVVEDHASRW